MKTVSFADAATGLFVGYTYSTSDDAQIAQATPPGHIAVEGRHDHRSKRLDLASGKVVDYSPPVSAPSRAEICSQIWALESGQHRAIREITLGVLGAAERLRKIDDEITQLRKQLKE